MKRGFEENVPRVRPRVRLGITGSGEPGPGMLEPDTGVDTSTDTPPDHDAAAQEPVAPVTIAPLPVAPVGNFGDTNRNSPISVGVPEIPDPEKAIHRAAAASIPIAPPVSTATSSIPRPRAAAAVELARQLTSDLGRAAEVNAKLRAELESALSALRAAAEESRQDRADRERIAGEAQSLAEGARRLEEDLQLVAGERDGALGQVARLSRELRDEKLRGASAAEESRKARAEAAVAQEESRRLAAELSTRAAEIGQARALADATRVERDSMAAALLAARAEAEEAARSRSALEEIHRALEDARARVSRIR
jgi:hypothetical protein